MLGERHCHEQTTLMSKIVPPKNTATTHNFDEAIAYFATTDFELLPELNQQQNRSPKRPAETAKRPCC